MAGESIGLSYAHEYYLLPVSLSSRCTAKDVERWLR